MHRPKGQSEIELRLLFWHPYGKAELNEKIHLQRFGPSHLPDWLQRGRRGKLGWSGRGCSDPFSDTFSFAVSLACTNSYAGGADVSLQLRDRISGGWSAKRSADAR